VASRTVEPETPPGDALDGEELLRLALSLPREALRRSELILATRPDPSAKSYVLQAAGIASRELGHGPEALRYVRRALRAAEQEGRTDRIADITATLGATLAQAGRPRDALEALNRAVDMSRGLDAARGLVRGDACLF